MTRTHALAFASALMFACSSSDTKLERRGGPLPAETAVGGADSAPDDSSPDQRVSFCEVLTVMRDKCQRCHQDPPMNSAPVPFLTYEDTQAPYYDTDSKYSDIMPAVITRGFMPYVSLNDGPDPITPPVEALTPDEKSTLLDWLAQGAKPEGGTNCP